MNPGGVLVLNRLLSPRLWHRSLTPVGCCFFGGSGEIVFHNMIMHCLLVN